MTELERRDWLQCAARVLREHRPERSDAEAIATIKAMYRHEAEDVFPFDDATVLAVWLEYRRLEPQFNGEPNTPKPSDN